ncbi:amidohydrolase [uncultured Amaricoccus sp.]|uniref:amidohydrolase family protein n=1 Tax=uncultured Amaricoccus sp. TaxID=339341 RepID=UPI00261AB277|nr:amidohydrolase [uncultured Amaricoccus sp.]
MTTILADGWLITMNPARDVLEAASVCVEKDRIVAIGTRDKLARAHPQAEIVDCGGRIVMPGMVNTHTHLFQTLLKGLGDDMALKEWFSCMTGPSAVHLTTEDAKVAALHGCIESLRSGVTTLVDFNYVHTRPGMAEATIEAFEETGIRGFVCRGFMTCGEAYGVPGVLIETPSQALAGARALIEKQNRTPGRVRAGIAPCMIWTVEEEALRLARRLADETGALLTTHVAETSFEIEEANRRYGRTDTEFLSDISFLGPDVLAVHCVQCRSRDIRVLRHHDVKVSHNPCSNLYLGSGIPPIPEMLASGITVGLGSDGPASSNNHSLFQAMKFAALLQKGAHRDPTILTAEKAIEMATIDGAHAVGLGNEIGSIEPGKKADIIVIDASGPSMTPIHNPVSALVYSALGNEVTDVMVDGRFAMRGGAILGVLDTAISAAAQTHADALARRAGSDRFRRRGWRSVAI